MNIILSLHRCRNYLVVASLRINFANVTNLTSYLVDLVMVTVHADRHAKEKDACVTSRTCKRMDEFMDMKQSLTKVYSSWICNLILFHKKVLKNFGQYNHEKFK